MSEVKHTPTPWSFEKVGHSQEANLTAGAEEIGLLYQSNGLDEPNVFPAIANAAFIVLACNCFDDMLAALKASIDAASRIDEPGGWDRAMQAKRMTLDAIAKAEGK